MQDTPIINPNAPTPNPTGGIQPADLMSEIQKQLLNSSSAISSNSSRIENTITGAIAKTQESNDAAKKATELAFNGQIDLAKTAGANAETSFTEASRGYATNTAALRDLRASNEKSIRDLESRKQEALLSADSATASKISELILKKYEFEQDATQKVFQNLVSLNSVALQNKQEQRLGQTQTFNEEQAKSNIALKYGIEVQPGDTLQDVVNRAKPFASKEQQLQLDQATANLALTKENTNKAKAEAVKALRDSKAVAPIDSASIQVIAQNLKDAGGTANAIKAQLATAAGITDKAAAYAIVDKMFAPASSSSSSDTGITSGSFGSPLLNTLANFGEASAKPGQTILDFIFGKQK